MFGTPQYGGSISQNVYYIKDNLCHGEADIRGGYPQRGKDSSGRMKPIPSPFILMVDSGGCSFVTKVRNKGRNERMASASRPPNAQIRAHWAGILCQGMESQIPACTIQIRCAWNIDCLCLNPSLLSASFVFAHTFVRSLPVGPQRTTLWCVRCVDCQPRLCVQSQGL